MESANLIEGLLSQLTPERLLRDVRATGEGVRVAVVDSGIEWTVLAERARQRGVELLPVQGAVFRPQGTPLPYTGRQSSPHGTTVADIIVTLAPRVQLYSADVFAWGGGTSLETVLAALQYALDVWQVKIINLSLGIVEQRLQPGPRRWQLLQMIEQAYYRDVLVVAAAHNDHPFTRSYPAAFAPPLLSVDKGVFADPLQVVYRLHEQVEFQAHGRGYLGPYATEPATSWAAAHLTGIAARLLSLKPDLKPFEVKTLLYWLSRNRNPATSPHGTTPTKSTD
ncbi:MAG: S8 family serine peptidase [Gemmataceae bacterium]|nr:S8 family serine peptidase [Gemmataceae bacterium]MCS7271130.1 S8 family serine peptidase [Gemmataceae bacterium]MDW8243125.1 S8 family serine peptidase [Thermogemmata sp.]